MSIALLMAMASCSSSDDEVAENKAESKLVPMTFTATQESNVGTRAALDGNSVIWKDGDKISVFDGEGDSHNQTFTLTGNVAEGKFSGTASSEATSFTAVYPYTEGAQLGEDGIVSGITLPAAQTATEGSFDPKAALMMAVSTEENKNKLNFKNAISLVKVTPKFDCTKIELEAAEESSDFLAGKGTLKWNGGQPTINITEETSKIITLNGPIEKNKSYYIVVPTGTLNRMWKITFFADGGEEYTRYCSKSLTIERNKIIDLGVFETSSLFWTDEHRGTKVTYEQEVDMGITTTINGQKYNVIFSKTNLTKNGLAAEESDFGDYFAFAATEPWVVSYTRGIAPEGVKMDNLVWKWTDEEHKTYGWPTVPFRDGTNNYCSKYTSPNAVLDMSDDAARQILHGDWRLPTIDIWKALCDKNKYKWDWTTIDGYNGYKVTSQTDYTKTIFLPAPGYATESSFYSVGSNGHYWSGTAYSSTNALDLFFNKDEVNGQNSDLRYRGFSVRPVRLVAVQPQQ